MKTTVIATLLGTALLLAGSIVQVASANDCAAQCYAQENACRRATADDPKCGADLTKCLQSCRAQK